MGTYVVTSEVQDEVGFTISSTTTPNSTTVSRWIDEEESEVDSRGIGEKYVTNYDFDLEHYPRHLDTIFGESEDADIMTESLIVPVPNFPIGVVSALKIRDSGLTETPVYTTLIEGPAASADFVKLESPNLHGENRTVAFVIFNNIPTIGYKRLRMDAWIGYKMNSNWIKRYLLLKVCVRVIRAKWGTSNPTGATMFTMGSLDTELPTDYRNRLRAYQEELMSKELEIPKRWSETGDTF